LPVADQVGRDDPVALSELLGERAPLRARRPAAVEEENGFHARVFARAMPRFSLSKINELPQKAAVE
jgi:hypothetical protein